MMIKLLKSFNHYKLIHRRNKIQKKKQLKMYQLMPKIYPMMKNRNKNQIRNKQKRE